MRRLFDCGAYSTAALILKIVKNTLVVPAKFTASTTNRRFAHVLDSELNSKKEKYIHLELLHEPNCCKKYPVIKSLV